MIESESSPTVLLADDQDLILAKVKEILPSTFRVVATLNDGREVARTAAKLRPDIVILDIGMPEVDGLTAGREIRRLGLPVKLIFVTVQEDPDCVQAAAALDASYVLKRRMHIDLLIALEEALAGRTFVSRQLSVSVAK
jgi:NarL family two-component system response regulator LiaR